MASDREYELLRETERLKGELDAERSKLDLVLQSIVDGVYMTDLDRSIVYWNAGAERITGFRTGDVKGRLCRTLLAHTDDEGRSLCDNECPLTKTMDKKDPIYSMEVYSKTADGTLRPVSVSCAPLVGMDGEVVGAVEVFRDMTAKKEIERQKAALYSMVTHDLKTPLMLILGYTELLMDMGREDALKNLPEFLKAVHGSGKRLQYLIEDFLAISHLGGEGMKLDLQPALIGDLLGRLHSDFGVVAGRKGVSVEYRPEPGLPVLEFDIRLVERALSNLLNNAVKFTPAGGVVTITARPLHIKAGDGHADGVSVTVSDTGPGIPAHELPHVFDMYYRASGAAGVEGTGLGLAIVKAVAKAHGGLVSVESAPGNGASFTLSLPLSPKEPLSAS